MPLTGWNRQVIEKVYNRANGECFYCGTTLSPFGTWEIDHIVPRCQQGSDDLSNLVAACRDCNRSKRGRNLEEFRKSKEDRLAHDIERIWLDLTNRAFEEDTPEQYGRSLMEEVKALQYRLWGVRVLFYGERKPDWALKEESAERERLLQQLLKESTQDATTTDLAN